MYRSRAFLLVPTFILFVLGVTLGLFACGGGGGGDQSEMPVPTAPDTTRPTVSSTSPANIATGVALNSSVSATFSEAMDNATLTNTSFTLAVTGGAAVIGTVNITGNTATFTPTASLAGSTQFTATITTAVTDAAGNALLADYSWNFATGVTPDTTRPTVSSTSPANIATDVALNSSVSATFSEAMDNATLTNTSFTLAVTGGAAVIGTVNITGNTATFTPTASLAGSTQFTATITTAVTDAAGNALLADYSWNFATGVTPDTTRPTVSSTSPANIATDVALNSSVSATFSEAIDPLTLTTASFTLATISDGTSVSGTVSLTGNTASFTPLAPLAPSTQYTATITTDAKDAAGNALLADYSWNFATGVTPDTTRPTVSSTSPANIATDVALNSSVSATFSEAMDPLTLTTASFTLATISDGTSVSGTVSLAGNTASFTPLAPLAPSTQYTATITTDAKDAAGNALLADYSWNFTTAPVFGLEFPSNDQVLDGDTVRFKFTDPHSNGLPIYGPGGNGVTYIFKVRPKQQTGYYTTFFWANDNGVGDLSNFLWRGGGADSYYGMHPYPPGSSSGTSHQWEISIEQNDFLNGTVVKDVWYTQAVRVWADASGKHHEFYWDWPNTDPAHMVTHTAPTTWGNTDPPSPALTFGDAPWQPGREMCSCTLRGIQIYSSLLSLADIQAEIASPQSTQAGSASIWYLNLNPTPTDISDKSGRGNNPVWVGDGRPNLWSQ